MDAKNEYEKILNNNSFENNKLITDRLSNKKSP